MTEGTVTLRRPGGGQEQKLDWRKPGTNGAGESDVMLYQSGFSRVTELTECLFILREIIVMTYSWTL